MANFTGLFSGNKTTAPVSTSNKFQGIFTAPKAPTASFEGNGYGAMEATDPYSGKPILKAPLQIPETYSTPAFSISVGSPERVATTFDPTKPQKITRDMLRNERLPESASQAIRNTLGAGYNEELDHQIALTLSGANTPENLKVIPTSKNQEAGTIEAKLANDVIAGKISLLDAQLQDAKQKGIKLPESAPSLIEKIRNEALKLNPQLLEPLASFQEDPLGLQNIDIVGAGKSFIDTIVNSVGDAGQKVADYFATLGSKSASTSEKLGKGMEALAGVGGAVFSPISAVFAGAEKLPVLKSASTLLSYPFSLLGEGGKVVVDRMLDKGILSTLPQETKDNIRQGAEEVGALTAQILGGAAIGKGIKSVLPSERAATVLRTEIKTENPELSTQIDKAPTKTITNLVNDHGKEGAKLIIKQSAETAKGIETGTLSPDKIVPEITKALEEKPVEVPVENKFQGLFKKEVPTESVTPTEIVNGTNEAPKGFTPSEITKQSGIGKSIEAKAVEDKLTEGFGKTAEYNPITIKEQAAKATDLVTSDLEKTRSIVRGEEPLPEGLKGTALITAMEEYIKKNPSMDLAYELANSPLVSQTSAAAQELRLAAERTPDSATAKLLEVRKAREEKVANITPKRRAKLVEDLKSETQKVNLSKEELRWDKFLDSITC